jgi:hypothetical protein
MLDARSACLAIVMLRVASNCNCCSVTAGLGKRVQVAGNHCGEVVVMQQAACSQKPVMRLVNASFFCNATCTMTYADSSPVQMSHNQAEGEGGISQHLEDVVFPTMHVLLILHPVLEWFMQAPEAG